MRRLMTVLLVAALGSGVFAGACGDAPGESAFNGTSGKAGSSSGAGGGLIDVNTSDVSDIYIEPPNPVLTVKTGDPVPTVQFSVIASGKPVGASFRLDLGELGTIDKSGGLFTPSGKVGGVSTVHATVGSTTVTTTVTVNLEVEQNGAGQNDPCSTPGGCGGVGGEGAGGAIDDVLKGLLEGGTTQDPALAFLYPYDKTVWPLGILGPLLMWTNTSANADAIMITLKGSNYSYKGFFGRPSPLSPGTPFVRHPIPQDVWKGATQSSRNGTLTASITIAAGGVAYGPLTETWTIAGASLKGTVYYQSYGTKLAKNYGGAIGGDGRFGGATLAIKGGSTGPVLVAGRDGGSGECRVCHSVSADGSRMVVQHGDNYRRSSSYALTVGGYPESSYAPGTDGTLGWPGIYPDGSFAISNAGPLSGGANSVDTGLYDLVNGAAIASNGLSSFVTKAGMPAFSPDGKMVVFNFYEGPGDASTGPGDGTRLVVMDFDKATNTFSNPRVLYTGAGQRPGWPSFLPSMEGVVFQVETQVNTDGEFMATRYGARGELWWSPLGGNGPVRLDRINGKGYAPVGPNNHHDDTTLSYEPTVSPIASGGYQWVVFTSRRLYGNVATIDPHFSDPREHDLTQTPTPKKLWVAAIDLPKSGENPQPGGDPSHPAFYLPAQELLAGNTRGFWVPDPCKSDGASCESGDECCGGFCTWSEQSQAYICGTESGECSQQFDKCVVDSDCCDFEINGLRCINSRCAQPGPA